MDCNIRAWRMGHAADLAAALNNPNIQNNLRDGLPYPYKEQDAGDYIDAIFRADENGKVLDMALYALLKSDCPEYWEV